jgi:BolA protein
MHDQINDKLVAYFAPDRLSIENDSHRHSGPAQDSHFRLIIVADAFAAMNPVARQRAVYACLAEEMAGAVHALQMKCMTPAEYDAVDGEVTLKVPPCRSRAAKA